MENPIFDELSLQIFENTKKSKIVIFVTSLFFLRGCKSVWGKGRLFSSLQFVYCIFLFSKSRRDVTNKKVGVTRHGESDFRWFFFSILWKNWIVENPPNPRNQKSQNPEIQKFEKSKIWKSAKMYEVQKIRLSTFHFFFKILKK